MAGRLVHRLFERMQAGAPGDATAERALARQLLTPEERSTAADAESVVDRALHAWRALRQRAGVQGLFEGGACLYEVPFSLREAATSAIVRGTIDCLVQRPDGSVAVIELKTGAPRREHEQQLAAYVTAARALFPSTEVKGILLYAIAQSCSPAAE